MLPPGRPRRTARSREDLARAVVKALLEARREAGISRQQLSERSGVSVNTIAKIEQAAVSDPGFSVVATIAVALELPLDVLAERARDTIRP